MNSGMGTMLTDKTAFSGANLLPTALETDLDGLKTTMNSFALTSLNNTVCQITSL